MNNRIEKKRRRFMRESLTEKINNDASRLLKSEIFRLARNRDVLGIFLIIAVGVIITLSIFLYKHW